MSASATRVSVTSREPPPGRASASKETANRSPRRRPLKTALVAVCSTFLCETEHLACEPLERQVRAAESP